MKNVALAIFIALLLTSSAFATNFMSQSNSQTASGTSSVIDQSSVNMGIQVGEGNKLIQNNEASASVSNVVIASPDSIANGAVATATLNDVWIRQLQFNLGIQIGKGNLMVQKNNADADIANVAVVDAASEFASASDLAPIPTSSTATLSHVAIIQAQANLVIQVGKGNKLIQKNNADADIANVAVARSDSKLIWPDTITQVPEGTINPEFPQWYTIPWYISKVTATATLDRVVVNQAQANLGIQIGKENKLVQKNNADADLANVAVAKAKTVGVGAADVSQTASATANGIFTSHSANNVLYYYQLADAGATVTAAATLEKIAVKQAQTNLGVQVGKKNDMDQKNNADADLSNVAVAKAKAVSVDDLDLTQTATAAATGFVAGATADNTANINPNLNVAYDATSTATATATATATLDKVAVKQVQTNLGVQVGEKNHMDQKNNADADLTNKAKVEAKAVAVNDIDVTQTADAEATSFALSNAEASNQFTATQTSSATANAEGTATLEQAAIKQAQTNLGIQVGEKNHMDQSNKADTDLTNVAVAKSKAVAINDISGTETATAIVTPRYFHGVPLLGAATSSADNVATVDESTTATSDVTSSATSSDLKVKQEQTNLGVQVGVKNHMNQKNKADTELTNVAVSKAHAVKVNPFDITASDPVVLTNQVGLFKHADADTSKSADQPLDGPAPNEASATLSDISVKQDQNNVGVQVGYHNLIIQKNKDTA